MKKTVCMVTHSVGYAQQADFIWVMEDDQSLVKIKGSEIKENNFELFEKFKEVDNRIKNKIGGDEVKNEEEMKKMKKIF